jgi:DNA helicase-2/ATP-dependent DNA helicase PcrA
MRVPTPEQRKVLESTARIRVVRASPGSGKTAMVGMLIRKELEGWTASPGGIAALSFTRVGGHEIRTELGYDLGHPHFVGTIDAFLFRYVVRPFLTRVRPTWASPRLVPAAWSPAHWGRRPDGAAWDQKVGRGSRPRTYNLFKVCFVDEDIDGPILAHPPPYQAGLEPVPPNDRADLLDHKRRCWQRLGWITHADAALLASELLHDATHEPVVRALLLRRFPLLIVDELQDTGFFLANSLRGLLEEEVARGVLVGDPNQAIYEFNGARPELFDEFERLPGAVALPLGGSQRCPTRVVVAASHVKESGDPFTPRHGEGGRTFLVRYTDMEADMPRLVGAIRVSRPTARTMVIARQTKAVEALTSRATRDANSLHCPALMHMYRGVRSFRQGHNVTGLASARAALELAVVGHEGVPDEKLEECLLDPREWKRLAVRCLLRCNALVTAANFHEWQSAAGRILDEEVTVFGLPASLPYRVGRLRPQQRPGWDRPASDFIPATSVVGPIITDVPVQTVHSVKGETHDVTVFVCPEPSAAPRCPSVVWWSEDAEHREERRIAYVAMTRTRGDLVVCVSDACYQRLRQNRAAFVASFECVTVDEFITAFP